MYTVTAKYIKSDTQVLPTLATVEVEGWRFEAQYLGPFDPLLAADDDPSEYAPGWTWTASKPGEFAMSEESITNPAPDWAVRLGRALIEALRTAPNSKDYHNLATLEITY